MGTWVIVAVVIAVIVLVGLALWAINHSRKQRVLEERRVEAADHREKAELQALRAARREQVANDELQRAERERSAAQAHVERADELDSDLEEQRR